jgi:hypothetical protein
VRSSRIENTPDLKRATLHGAATVSEGVVALQDDFAGRDQIVERVDGFGVLSLFGDLLVGIKVWSRTTNFFSVPLEVVNKTFKVPLGAGSRTALCP